jgi:hypothetical protein
MAVTVLSGTSGALYYKPAGTTGSFPETGVNASTDVITVQQYLNLKAGDPVKFRIVNNQTGEVGTGTLPAPISADTTYYVLTYTAATGALTVSTAAGGTILAITDDGTAVGFNEFEVYYAEYASVGQVQLWSLEISRADIDVTTIGQVAGQLAPSRSYIPGFADGAGTATVYVTNEDAALSNRMVEDVLQRQQVGCGFKLYTDQGRSITMDAVLLSASLNINPDDAQQVEITFRPGGAPTFDFNSSAGGGVVSDPNWTSVRLLVGCNSLPATDESSFATPIGTNTTAPLLDTSIKKFDAASFSFPGDINRDLEIDSTNNNLDVAASTPFTWECWIYLISLDSTATGWGNVNAFMESQGGSDYVAGVSRASSGADPQFYFIPSNGTTGGFYHQSTVPLSTWVHWALVRDSSNNIHIYQDGVKSTSSVTSSLALDNSSTVGFTIGKRQFGTSYNFRMDEVRITVGVARYTTDFTPPLTSFPRS